MIHQTQNMLRTDLLLQAAGVSGCKLVRPAYIIIRYYYYHFSLLFIVYIVTYEQVARGGVT